MSESMRAELDRRRSRLAVGQPMVEEPEPEPLQVIPLPLIDVPDIIYRLQGAVGRGDGRYTIWLNGRAIHQDNLPSHMQLLEPFSEGRLLISNPETGIRHELKPGQVLNYTTGEIVESWQETTAPAADTTPEAGAPSGRPEAADTDIQSESSASIDTNR